MNITIILTSTVFVKWNICSLDQVNPSERLETYIKAIYQWLLKTNFNIILVENSGFHYSCLNYEKEYYRHRFEVISFQESELEEANYLKDNIAKGASEIFAINYVFLHSKLIHASKFIIKITGRYFIPELEEYLRENIRNIDKYDCLTQHNRCRCEMVGCHYRMFSYIFDPILLNENQEYDGHIENIWKMRTSRCKNILVCKEFTIESTPRGGVPDNHITI